MRCKWTPAFFKMPISLFSLFPLSSLPSRPLLSLFSLFSLPLPLKSISVDFDDDDEDLEDAKQNLKMMWAWEATGVRLPLLGLGSHRS